MRGLYVLATDIVTIGLFVRPFSLMTILYIGGAGRSGSTLLELVLGNQPGFFSVGEIRFFWQYVVQSDFRCGCGEPLIECSFWQPVRDTLVNQYDVDLQEMASLSRSLNRTRRVPFILSPLPNRAMGSWDKLRKNTQLLYRVTGEQAGCEVLVDSSKVPSQLALLTQDGSLDCCVLHLIRDCRAVAYSWSRRQKKEAGAIDPERKMPSHGTVHSALTWLVENWAVSRLARHLTLVQLRYEDFCQDPYGSLTTVFDELGVELPNAEVLANGPVDVQPTHSVGGNPLRFDTREVQIKAHTRWKDGMPPAEQWLVGALCYPLLRRYGYRLTS